MIAGSRCNLRSASSNRWGFLQGKSNYCSLRREFILSLTRDIKFLTDDTITDAASTASLSGNCVQENPLELFAGSVNSIVLLGLLQPLEAFQKVVTGGVELDLL